MVRPSIPRFERWALSATPAALLLLLIGCTQSPGPVTRVTGPSGSMARIAGDWSGDYRLSDGSRRGTIMFHLTHGDSVASGQVLMVPPTDVETPVSGEATPTPREHRRPVQPVDVTFIGVQDDRVRGTLRPYRDPECLCDVETTFEGKLNGELIEGTFLIHQVVDGRNRTGRWSVRRRPSR